jgi:hypothetical protein
MSGAADRGLPLAREALATSRQLGAPGLIAWNLMALAAGLADRDPEQTKILLDESERTAALLGDPNIRLSSWTALVAAYLGDWDRVLRAAPVALRGFLWSGGRFSLAGQFNVVARAIAPIDAETAALLQGAVRRLVAPPRSLQPGQGTEQDRSTPEARTTTTRPGAGGVIAELRQQTTAILRGALGETRLRELRAAGAAMDDDHLVALALDAVVRTQAAANR